MPHVPSNTLIYLRTSKLRSEGWVYLTERVYNVAVQKSISPQIRYLILHISNKIEQVDGLVGGTDY